MARTFRTRFAPSPTGFLHIGHAYAAFQAFRGAEEAAGECLLRIEDIDQTRCRREYDAAITEDLEWLGFSWPQPVRRQSDHYSDYVGALRQLDAQGLVYRCFLTRKQLTADLERRGIAKSPAGETPYPGPVAVMSVEEAEERAEAGEAYAWRLSLDRCRDVLGADWTRLAFMETGDAPGISVGETLAHPDWLGDVVLARKDSPTSYHLAVCHDDALQEISHVVRGADLYHATHIHVLLQRLLGWPQPVYRHHRLLLDRDGRKFSKSDRSKTLRSLREEGMTPETLFDQFPEP